MFIVLNKKSHRLLLLVEHRIYIMNELRKTTGSVLWNGRYLRKTLCTVSLRNDDVSTFKRDLPKGLWPKIQKLRY